MTTCTKIVAAGLSAFSFCALSCQAFADPLASSSFASKSGFSDSTHINDIHNVQLLVDIKTGLELNQIKTLIPTAKVLEKSGKVFVYVTQTKNARTAYNLGKSLQDKFNVTFNLAYSDGHPDLNLAWMKSLTNTVAAKVVPARPTVKPSSKEVSPSPEIANSASLTKDMQLISTVEEAGFINSQQPLLKKTSSDKLAQNNVFAQSVPIEAQTLVIEDTDQNVKSNLADASNPDVQSGSALSSSEAIASIPHNPDNEFDPSNESFTAEKADNSNTSESYSLAISSSNRTDNPNKKKQRKSISETLRELRSINFSANSENKIALAENSTNRELLLTSEVLEVKKSFASFPVSLDHNKPSDINYLSSNTSSVESESYSTDTISQLPEISDLLTAAEPEELQVIPSSVVDTYEESKQSVSSISESFPGSSEVESLKSNIDVKDSSTVVFASNEKRDLKVQNLNRKEGIAKIRQSLKSLPSKSSSVKRKLNIHDHSIKQKSSLINTVAILPTHIGDLPIYNSRFTAINNKLAYVYVEVKNESDASNVKQIKGVYGLQVRDGKLLARVGIYTESTLGKRLLNQKLEKLEQSGWSVELALNYNSVNA